MAKGVAGDRLTTLSEWLKVLAQLNQVLQLKEEALCRQIAYYGLLAPVAQSEYVSNYLPFLAL